MSDTQPHVRTATEDFLGWTATCSCGWVAGDVDWPTHFNSKIEALGAGDRHLASVMDRAAWKQA